MSRAFRLSMLVAAAFILPASAATAPAPLAAPAQDELDAPPPPLPEGAEALPHPVRDLQAGVATYTVTSTGGPGSGIPPFTMVRTIGEKDGAWSITNDSRVPAFETSGIKIPGMTITDVTILEKKSLVLRKHSSEISNAPLPQEEIEFKGGTVSGTTNYGGKPKTVNIDLGGALFGGQTECLACLPLAEGFATSYRSFVAFNQKTTRITFRVVGTETLTVGGVPRKAWKAEMTPDEMNSWHNTVWIAQDAPLMLKMVTNTAGTQMTMDLVP